MFSKVYSAALEGMSAYVVQVEADVSDGLPCLELVGLLGTEVREAKERVRVALKNAEFRLPPKRITINLSPADVRKEGTMFDLAIAISILTASGHIPEEFIEKTVFIGELSLDAGLHRINGVLPMVTAAKEQGFVRCILPKENAREGAVISEIEMIGVSSLKEAFLYLMGALPIDAEFVDVKQLFEDGIHMAYDMDFHEVCGQESAKRAIEVAVAGMHHLMMIGTPGSGKTMLAKRIPTIMPELTLAESLELTKVYSVSGHMDSNQPLLLTRPFRAPHHSITSNALVGGGRYPRPGEISLATNGVLFLDELPEFDMRTLELLRQPLEERRIMINRLNGCYEYPANLMLVAAMNPCKCGYYPNRLRCHCSYPQIHRYLNHISGPLLDRIDVFIETSEIDYHQLHNTTEQESSSCIRKRIQTARRIQLKRYEKEAIYFNAQLSSSRIRKYCVLGKNEQQWMEKVFDQLELSSRGYHRILKVARTIADLEESEDIKERHLSEAVCYRSFEHKYWMGGEKSYAK